MGVLQNAMMMKDAELAALDDNCQMQGHDRVNKAAKG